jgi:hypothetical protein
MMRGTSAPSGAGAWARPSAWRGLHEALRHPAYLTIFGTLAALIGLAYAYFLGAISTLQWAPWAIWLLTPAEAIFALVAGVLLSLTGTLRLYCRRSRVPCHAVQGPTGRLGSHSALGLAVATLASGSACCSPVVLVIFGVGVSGSAGPASSAFAPSSLLGIFAPALYLGAGVALLLPVYGLCVRIATTLDRSEPNASGSLPPGTSRSGGARDHREGPP